MSRPPTVFVDADACPVRQLITAASREQGWPVVMVADTSHHIQDGYSQIVTVDKARDSADLAILNRLRSGDIVVTQDYGVAAMALGKGAAVLHHNGMEYSPENIDLLLMERHISGKQRRAGGRVRGPRPRKPEENLRFDQAFRSLLSRMNQRKREGQTE